MKKSILFLCVFIMCFLVMKAENRPVIIHGNGGHNHGGFIMADMPDAVYYDSDEMEIIIEADGVSQYYFV